MGEVGGRVTVLLRAVMFKTSSMRVEEIAYEKMSGES
jgi:hypothetical protein